MNEIVIKKVDYLTEKDIYVARCIVVIGKISSNTTWNYKYNAKRKIVLELPFVENNMPQESYLVDFIIKKTDINIFNKPTSWINI